MGETQTVRIARSAAVLGLLAFAPAPASATNDTALEALKEEVEALVRQNAEMLRTIEVLEKEVDEARNEARAAQDMALARASTASVGYGASSAREDALYSQPLGGVRAQLLDISLDVLTAGGWSTADNQELENLQGGDHDPRQRGFTLQQAELSFSGAVDPYFAGEAHLIYFLDTEGESRFELEEAFATTQMLPFGLEEHGLQLEVGTFFTEFGRLNPRHPHAWSWQDQPVILTRLFGGDGMRGPGVRTSWLTPLPWFSELQVGFQNAKGETMVSFLANDEVFEERPIGGRPFADEDVGSPDDLVKLLRWVNGFDFSDTLSSQLGLSFLHGPNATGDDGRTLIYGADLVLKWRPLTAHRGWPFLSFEAEIMKRDYRADSFFGCPAADDGCSEPLALPSDTLHDWGGYAQVLWGFRRNWGLGLRYEYATGSGDDFDAAEDGFVSRDDDPFRDDRHRVSPLLVFHPSEFSRLRLQYNYDRADFLDGSDAHSVWAGLEFLFGAHAAHSY
jgi:hypothetical protein